MATLSQLLAIPDLGLRLIQAGRRDPELTWGSVTELLNLSEYLEGGEIIMTTGLALGGDDPRWRDFVASLSRAQVAAIGFGIGVNHDRVPPQLVQAASTYQVALFEIALPTPFIAISKAIAELLRTDELRETRNALRIQERLLDSARSEQEPAAVLASIAQATGRQLGVVSNDGSVLAATGGFAAAQTAAHGAAPGSVQAMEQVPLNSAGSLQLHISGGTPLSPEGRSVIAAGAIVLGLGIRGSSAAEARERQQWARLTEGLLTGTQAPAALSVLFPSHPLPETVRAVAVQGSAEDLVEWRSRSRSGFERLITSALPHISAPGIAQAWQLVPDTSAAIDAAVAAAHAHDLDVVLGRPVTAEDAPLSRRSALAKLPTLSTTAPLYIAPRVPETIWADRTSPVLETLMTLPGNAADGGVAGGYPAPSAELAARVLGPLARESTELTVADRETLRVTLRAVFEADGQRGPAATALGIHRNTLRDRMQRIERLIGRSLSEPDDRAEIWIALRLEEQTFAQ